MEILEAINKIYSSNCDYKKKYCLATIASEWDVFIKLKKKHPKDGLMKACYRELGIKFPGMYGINKLEDLVDMAERNSLI